MMSPGLRLGTMNRAARARMLPVLIGADDNVPVAGTEILPHKLARGLDAQTLFDSGGTRAWHEAE